MDNGYSILSGILTLVGTFFASMILKHIISLWIESRNRLPYPPGPKPKPIIGNMFDFPTTDIVEQYTAWGKKYNSNILHASALGSHIVILNSLEDAEELLDKRAHNYSDRLELPMVELMGYGVNMAFMKYGTLWRQHRRIAQQNFRLDTMSTHEPIQSRRVHLMLKGLLDDPDNLFTLHKVLSMSIPLEFMYGYDVKSVDDPFITQAERALNISAEYFHPESTLINFFPVLGKIPAWIPGATAQKVAAKTSRILKNLETEPLDLVQKAMDKGEATPSVLSAFIEAKRGTPEFEEEAQVVSQLALTIFSGASDTIISAFESLFYLLATRPDIQKRGQEEIDRVIGRERLPEFGDRVSLPYTDAIYRELLRYWPPTPLAIPHCTRADDTYKGYFIPKGTVIFPNVWAMARDEKLYSDPYEFKPERFIDENGRLIKDTRILTYGFGRRICPGKYSASATLWLTIASTLACFNVGKARDERGNEIELSDKFVYHTITGHITPFKCSITPRSQLVPRLVEEAVAAEQFEIHHKD
ncbi:cytochrome P450 [Pholiota conissans]|uniref:Cytochrome P450 n=1 Tax=Pholiota conissans TaxID=109636 RepID=A0A9P5ZEX7_9AGAR|nr:cytochrome P450 [Pholiota conissans]